MDRMKESALVYAQRFGFAVFPVNGKVPFSGTRGYKDATKDPAVVKDLWTRYYNANIGIATGAISGIDVIDIDPRNGGMETWSQFGLNIECPTVLTGGGGLHLYLSCQYLEYPKSLGPGIDIKSDGGYVVAPPSIHNTSGRYTWDDVLHLKLVGLPDLPPLLRDRIAELSDDGPHGKAHPMTNELEAEVRRRLPDGVQRRDQYFHTCPFHEDNDPSFNVNFKLGVYHCFGCRESGTVRQLVYRLRYF